MSDWFAPLTDFSVWQQALGGPLLWLAAAAWSDAASAHTLAATTSATVAVATLAAALGLALALAIDWRWGEPPPRCHPVVWMGAALAWSGQRIAPTSTQIDFCTSRPQKGLDAPSSPSARHRLLGMLAWSAQAFVWTAIFSILQITLLWAGPLALALGLGVALKPLLAWRMLRDEVAAVEVALGHSLEAGRARLAWLVSRDTSELPPHAVREAAIETLAENLSDALIAPLLCFALFGLGGAALYRFTNTADAMWGYPDWRKKINLNKDMPPTWQYWRDAGWWAARCDDWLNWPAARLTALGLWWASHGRHQTGAKHQKFLSFFKALRHNAAQTPSPNGGWPMGAVALLLDLRLTKPSVYALNPTGAAPDAQATARALALTQNAARKIIWSILCGIFLGVWLIF